jgi:filamentous hemagglutinin
MIVGAYGGIGASANAAANALKQLNKATRLPTLSRACPPKGVSASAGRGVWDKPPAIRGEIIEKQLGQNLPKNFPTIDKFKNGVATSIKSMDLAAPSYADPAAITRVGQKFIDDVAAFKGRSWGGASVPGSQITGKAVEIAIPPKPTPAQVQALENLKAYGTSKGVTVHTITVSS